MPPGPVFNWLCVAHGLVDILSHAAQIRAMQVSRRCGPTAMGHDTVTRKRKREDALATPSAPYERSPASVSSMRRPEEPAALIASEDSTPSSHDLTSASASERPPPLPQEPPVQRVQPDHVPPAAPVEIAPKESLAPFENSSHVESSWDISSLAVTSEDVPVAVVTIPEPVSEPTAFDPPAARKLQSSRVPSSRVGRLFHYGGLAASLGYGAASELLRRSTSDDNTSTSLMLTEGNIKRLVSKLTQLRGAALKLGQFMSIQDSHVLPPEIEDIFRRVQDSAHYMPDWQMEDVLRAALGPSWADHFESFDRLPFAAASIGQVHSAVLRAASSPTGAPARVAVKIQFPNIAGSIASDLGYVKMLLTAGRLLPRGLFLDNTIRIMKEELADECDYVREASFLRRFGAPACLGSDPRFKVPWVWAGSTERVLVMEHVEGVSVGGATIDALGQRERNDIAARIIELCLKELFVFRAMQTDPNWTNFLWNTRTEQIALVDFGAARAYSKTFIDSWLRLLQAAVSGDRAACVAESLALGYLTGAESEVMRDTHVRSMTLLATPFKADTPQPFTFGPGSQWTEITAEIRTQIPVMLKHRLTPPPRETYSLNRKLSGSFLLAARLNAVVDCKALWDQVVKGYQFGPISDEA